MYRSLGKRPEGNPKDPYILDKTIASTNIDQQLSIPTWMQMARNYYKQNKDKKPTTSASINIRKADIGEIETPKEIESDSDSNFTNKNNSSKNDKPMKLFLGQSGNKKILIGGASEEDAQEAANNYFNNSSTIIKLIDESEAEKLFGTTTPNIKTPELFELGNNLDEKQPLPSSTDRQIFTNLDEK